MAFGSHFLLGYEDNVVRPVTNKILRASLPSRLYFNALGIDYIVEGLDMCDPFAHIWHELYVSLQVALVPLSWFSGPFLVFVSNFDFTFN
jgi:hypothetical protein